MKKFIVVYRLITNHPSASGILPHEIIVADSQEDVPSILYEKMNLTKDEFLLKYEIESVTQL